MEKGVGNSGGHKNQWETVGILESVAGSSGGHGKWWEEQWEPQGIEWKAVGATAMAVGSGRGCSRGTGSSGGNKEKRELQKAVGMVVRGVGSSGGHGAWWREQWELQKAVWKAVGAVWNNRGCGHGSGKGKGCDSGVGSSGGHGERCGEWHREW